MISNFFKKEELDLDTPHTIYLNANRTLFVRVTLLDANHCIGKRLFSRVLGA